MTKTIIITSFHPHVSRNILASDAFRLLTEHPDLRIVLVVPRYKTAYFTQRFGGPRVSVEGNDLYQASRTRRGLFFKKLGVFLFDSVSARNRKRYDYYLNRKFLRLAAAMTLGTLGHVFVFRRLVRFLDFHLSPYGFFDDILARVGPDAVFSTDVQNENDVSLMQDACRRGIPVIAMVRSWDNLTLRILRIFPDRLIVGSQVLADELARFHRYPLRRIAVTGNPHYDRYRTGPSMSRDELLGRFGLDPTKKFILYAPISDALIRVNDADQHIMEILGTLDANILVRFPPEKGVRLEAFIKPANMAYDRPGQGFSASEVGDREIRPEDDEMLMNELWHTDVIVTGPTSIALDGMYVDKPVIVADFYPTRRYFFETVWRYTDDHIKKIIATAGVRYVRSKEAMLAAITEYLGNPAKDREGRVAARALWFSHADGQAGARLARELLAFVGLKS